MYVYKTKAIFPQLPACQELLRRMICGKCNLQAVATHSLSYRFMTVVKDAILEHPNQEVRTLQDVEKILQIRCILGSPAQVGESDADKDGFLDWQLVLYSCNLEGALGFIHFILDYKVRKNVLAGMPELAVHAAHTGRSPLPSLPPPWRKVDSGALAVPKPFSALPPPGRRHVLAQLERLEEPNSQGNASEGEDNAEQHSNRPHTPSPSMATSTPSRTASRRAAFRAAWPG